jgi:alanine-synthesizing transaminase
MQSYFARRTSWDLTTNRYTEALDAHRRAGRELLDLTASNPTTIGLQYRDDVLLRALANRDALRYEPQPKGLLAAREAVAAYYAERGSQISPDDLVLTTSTSEGYSFVFRLLCDPGDALLVPTPSYPLFDFLADIQDVKLLPYELVYDHGWQMDFASLQGAIARARTAGARCRAVLVVHPNNPTGSYVKPHEAEELDRICAERRSWRSSLMKSSSTTRWCRRDAADVLGGARCSDVHVERPVEDLRAAADEGRVDRGQRSAGAED